VAEGQSLLILKAMKMQHEVRAPPPASWLPSPPPRVPRWNPASRS